MGLIFSSVHHRIKQKWTETGPFAEAPTEEQKTKQDIRIGAIIRRMRKEQGIKATALVRLLQLEGVEITRESLVKIERGTQHIKASQLRGIRDVLNTTYDELLAEAEKR